MSRWVIWCASAALALTACGDDANNKLPDAPHGDGAVAKPLPAYDVTGGAQGLRGARFRADVQIGHPISQAPTTGNGKRLEGNAAVKP